VGLYGEQVLPRVMDRVCGMSSTDEIRGRLCAGLTGEVVEIGFGSGHNVRSYPSTITSVSAVEPSSVAWALAAERLTSAPVPVRRAGLDGQTLPFADVTFDSALSSWTLCTIPDVAAALLELRRVLKPGGAFHFVEHGLAPDSGVQRWQHRLEPVQRRLVGGCHLTRPIVELIEGAGFTVTELDVFYEKGAPKALGATSLGVARSPAD
jgi:SAM-dependent methyltransferase